MNIGFEIIGKMVYKVDYETGEILEEFEYPT